MSGYDIWTIRLELSLLSLSENTIAGNFDYFIEVETTDVAGQNFRPRIDATSRGVSVMINGLLIQSLLLILV